MDPQAAKATVKRLARAVLERHLKAHVVLCGFPRSGSTLLHLMIQTSVPDARCFPIERPALASSLQWPHREPHAFLVTKRPGDTLVMDDIRATYRDRRMLFLLCQRDPRAILTSAHSRAGSGYYVTPERWRALDEAYSREVGCPDTLVVEFADLVHRPDWVQARIDAFTGWTSASRFADYQAHIPRGFDIAPLNGVRPLDPSTEDKWRRPEHRERMAAVLRALPELPDRLIEMGYERDDTWTRR